MSAQGCEVKTVDDALFCACSSHIYYSFDFWKAMYSNMLPKELYGTHPSPPHPPTNMGFSGAVLASFFLVATVLQYLYIHMCERT
jgi:hypothetical protein